MSRLTSISVFATGLLLSAAAFSAGFAPGQTTVVTGEVRTPQTLTRMGVEQLPPQVIDVSFVTGHGRETSAFKGVLLSTLLARAGVERSAEHSHLVVVAGRDGSAVSLPMRAVEATGVLLAYDEDGQPLADGLRLVVPEEHHGARDVRDVARIEVR